MREEFLALRDAALKHFKGAAQEYRNAIEIFKIDFEARYEKELAEYEAEQSLPEGERPRFPRNRPSPWEPWLAAHHVNEQVFLSFKLSAEQKQRSEQLRVGFKKILDAVATSLRNSSLLTDADFRDLSQYGKTIVAAVEFNSFGFGNLGPSAVMTETYSTLNHRAKRRIHARSQAPRLLRKSLRRSAQVDGVWINILLKLGWFPLCKVWSDKYSTFLPPNTAFIMMRIAPEDPTSRSHSIFIHSK